MRGLIKLTNVDNVILIAKDGSFVIIRIEVIRSREESDYRGETGLIILPVHSVSSILSLMSTNNREKFIFVEELASGLKTER
jgi:hypothetical protein